MVYQILVILLILIEGVLIVISCRYLKNIRSTNKDCIAAINRSKENTLSMFTELKILIEITSNRENHMLHTVFYLEEIEMYLKKILKTLEQQGKPKVNEKASIEKVIN